MNKPCIKCGCTERYSNRDCKACTRVRGDAWAKANPDKVKAYKAAYRAVNTGKAKAYDTAYRAANREKETARGTAWRAANPEKIKAKNTAWRAANADKIREQSTAWRAANPERAKASTAAWVKGNLERVQTGRDAWNKANPEAGLIYSHTRRARKRTNGGTLSKGLSATLFKLQQGMCPCCRQPLGADYHLDHIMPLVLGGENTDGNVQLLRAVCNLQKNAQHPVAFMQSRGFLL